MNGEDPHEEAAEEVSRQLSLVEHLKKVKHLKKEYQKKLDSVSSQLSHLVQSQVEEVRQGVALFQNAEKNLDILEKRLRALYDVSSENGGWVAEYPLLKSVSSAGKKMDSVAQYLKKILEIPREVAELEEMLQELGPLNPHLDQLPPFGADEVLWSLYLKASKIDQLCYELGRGTAIAGAEGHQRGSEREEEDRESGNLALKGSSILQATVLPAKEAVDRAEGYLFSIVEHSISLCTSHPSLVVAAVAIIEEEEVNDAERENNADNPAPKRYRDRFTNTLREMIDRRFREVFDPVEGLKAHDVPSILTGFDALLDDLTTIMDDLMQCLPSHYRNTLELPDFFHQHFRVAVSSLAAASKDLTPADVLDIVMWINSYGLSLQRLGLEEGDPPLTDSLSGFVESYISTSRNLMTGWTVNILNVDANASVEEAEDGTLITLAPVDLFKMVTQQVDLVKDADNGKFLFDIAHESYDIICLYIKELKKRLRERWEEFSWDYLAAMVNNNIKSLELLEEFTEHCAGALSEIYSSDLPTSKPSDGFRDLVKLSVHSLAKLVIKDLRQLTGLLFHRECQRLCHFFASCCGITKSCSAEK